VDTPDAGDAVTPNGITWSELHAVTDDGEPYAEVILTDPSSAIPLVLPIDLKFRLATVEHRLDDVSATNYFRYRLHDQRLKYLGAAVLVQFLLIIVMLVTLS
jgi:hypothetical protein